MLGQLGAFAGVPIIGWIGAAIAIVGQMDQLIEGRESSIRQKISWIGGNEDVAGKYPFLTPSTQMIISLFSKESNHGGRLDFADGFFTVGGDKATKERKEQLNSTGDFINGMLDSLASIGIDARGIITKLQAGDRDGSKLYTASGKIYSSKETTSDGLAQLIIEALMGEAQFENPHLKEIVTQMVEANRSWDQILDKMEKFLAAEQLGKDIKTDLLKFTDPKEAAMRQLREEQISRRRQVKDYAGQGLYTAEELSAILADLGQLEVKETQAALEDLADAGDLAASSLKSITDAQSAILSYVQSLRTGTLSPLSPTAKLGLTKGAFETMLTAAQGGDIEALQNITSSANEYLSAAQQYFGSGQGY
ncbi:MAG: hypothetical protein KKA05_11855, partial [Alphaproteobacteria bacterium]|nr:hypothetical protein [Alphaproteobacteria bacterium]